MFSPFFVDSPYGYSRSPRHARQTPFFLDNDEEDEWSPFDVEPRRAYRPQAYRQPHPHAQQWMPHPSQQKVNRNRAPQAPINRTRVPVQQQSRAKPQPKPRQIELAVANDAAQTIQRVWRGYEVRKLQLIQKLKQLKKINDGFMLARLKFYHLQEVVENLIKQDTSSAELNTLQHFHKQILCLEEEMTKSLISLDAVSSGQSQLIRLQRKSIVDGINKILQALEPLKQASSKKLKELQEYKSQLEEQTRLQEQQKEQEVESSEDATMVEEPTASSSTVHSSETGLADNESKEYAHPVETEDDSKVLLEELPGNPYREDDELQQDEQEPQKEQHPKAEAHSQPHEMEVEPSPEKNDSDFVLIESEQVKPESSSPLEQPSYDELKLLVERQSQMLLEKDKRIQQLETRILKLESEAARKSSAVEQ